MNCDELLSLLERGTGCVHTEHGAQYRTHCLYPSFEQVAVYVSQWGDGFRVTDGGGAASCVLRHGRDETALGNAFKKARQRYAVDTVEGMVVAECDRDWLFASVLAVANAAALVAASGVKQVMVAQERALRAAIKDHLIEAEVPEKAIATEYEYVGESGKTWKLDYAVLSRRQILIKAITPHPNSVNANHTAFGDIGQTGQVSRLSVYQQRLKDEDRALMRQVAKLVPLRSLGAGVRREVDLGLH